MATYDLDCHDCGDPCTVHRKDGKFCRSCSLLRVLKFAAKLPRQFPKCRSCGEKFKPLNKVDYALCGTCTPRHPVEPANGQPADLVACAICKAPTPAYSGVAVCLPCLKSPEGRERIFKALRKGQANRKKANAGRPRREMRRLDTPTPARQEAPCSDAS